MATTEPAPVIDTTTILSLSAVLLLLFLAYTLAIRVLPTSAPSSHRILFIWHAFDALIHFIFEGSFLYNCFLTYTTIPIRPSNDFPHPASLPSSHSASNWLGHTDRLYGSFYGGEGNYFAKLWQVYARADRRWGGADATVVSLELLTVLGAGPLAVWCCVALARRDERVWIWMIVLATGELYGGFMTFCPEWLTGSPNLDTSNFMFLYVYLIFFNMLWVVFPIYAIYVAYNDICDAFKVRSEVEATKRDVTPRKKRV